MTHQLAIGDPVRHRSQALSGVIEEIAWNADRGAVEALVRRANSDTFTCSIDWLELDQ